MRQEEQRTAGASAAELDNLRAWLRQTNGDLVNEDELMHAAADLGIGEEVEVGTQYGSIHITRSEDGFDTDRKVH